MRSSQNRQTARAQVQQERGPRHACRQRG
jgi:hypothetical protein